MVRLAAVASAVALVGPLVVNAHGFMSGPMPEFKDIYNKQSPAGSMPGTPGPYSGNDEIKGLAEKAGSKCGKTNPNTVQPVPSGGAVSFTITAQHIGPCEIWLDNTRVVSAKDCWKEHPSKSIPVDFSKCSSGGCLLRWVWMATHTSPWEFYDNCVRVGGGGGGGGNNTTPAPQPTPEPSSSAPKPTPVPDSSSSSPKPSPGNDDDTPGTIKPQPDVNPNSGKCVQGKGGDAALTTWCKANCAAGFCPESHCEPCK